MSTTTDALLSCGVQAPGQTCDDVVTLWSPVYLVPLGIAALVAVTVLALLVVALVRLGRRLSRRRTRS